MSQMLDLIVRLELHCWYQPYAADPKGEWKCRPTAGVLVLTRICSQTRNPSNCPHQMATSHFAPVVQFSAGGSVATRGKSLLEVKFAEGRPAQAATSRLNLFSTSATNTPWPHTARSTSVLSRVSSLVLLLGGQPSDSHCMAQLELVQFRLC